MDANAFLFAHRKEHCISGNTVSLSIFSSYFYEKFYFRTTISTNRTLLTPLRPMEE